MPFLPLADTVPGPVNGILCRRHYNNWRVSLEQLVEPLLGICRTAGEAICKLYSAPGAGRFQAKGDESPLTQADLASDQILQAGLAQLQPHFPVLSEESTAEQTSRRREWPSYWLVDPLDGTKEFLARTGEFTINIALIKEHRPVLGVLYVPLHNTAYVGIKGVLALRYQWLANGQCEVRELATAPLREGAPLVLLASRRHCGKRLQGLLDWLDEHWGEVERRDSGSALKFCNLAEGEGDFYPRFSKCCEWDVAAGQAILEAVGGVVLGMDGQPLRYNLRDTLYSPPFYAIADAGHGFWEQLLQRPGRQHG